MLCLNDAVHAGSRDGTAFAALANPSLHPIDHFSNLHGMGANSQHIECCAFESLVDWFSRCTFGKPWRLCQDAVNGNPETAERRVLQVRSNPTVSVLERQCE